MGDEVLIDFRQTLFVKSKKTSLEDLVQKHTPKLC
jgi:hypothetical protein